MDEIWKNIPGSDYSVSNTGRVKSKTKILKGSPDTNGYPIIIICTNGIHKTRTIHTLVALAFLGPKPTPAHQVNHKNGIKADNRVDNLEWVTPSQNKRHSIDVLGCIGARGEANGASKLTEDGVRDIRARRLSGESQGSISIRYGIGRVQVGRIERGERWGWLK